ncbi:MAG: 23S rRNA (guanosine(2251)-2'-O)-methyltransferase RlmB [Thermodesulfovibrionales bacterium]|nr:23S rRNA (guanosine(2251)-2'-O)-methyltransferase RlmB [Thermodesulfovibrionales bacterium]
MVTGNEWLYGINPVLEALKAGREIKCLYISSQRKKEIKGIIELAEKRGVPIEYREATFFDFSLPKGNQGVAALAKRKALFNIDELLALSSQRSDPPFFIILDCIEDPRNFGAILRIAEAVAVHGVVFQSRRNVRLTNTVLKTSAGAHEYVNIAQVVNIKHAIEKMKRANITIIGAEADSFSTLWELDMRVPIAIVVGSEGKGLRQTVKEMCDFLVRIPMRGNITSLNVSTATGILAYEVLRQRMAVDADSIPS